MLEMFEPILHALPVVLQWQNLLAIAVGMIAGMIVGALPGLTVVLGISVLIPLTFGMDPLVALGMMAGIYNGGSYGGAIPAILLRIPGTPASVATVLDGYPMTQRGEAAYALQVAVVSGAIGSIVSALALLLFAPPLAKISLMFGPAEYFWVALFGLSTVSVLLGDDPLKGMIAACFGLFLGMVGTDNTSGYDRFTFDSLHLVDGLNIIVLLTGLYAVPPALVMAEKAIKTGLAKELASLKRTTSMFKNWTQFVHVWIRTSLVGIIIGILPGAAGSISAFVSYNQAKRVAKDPETFGKGNPMGVAGSECGNGADNAAAMIPALTLGIPGSGVAAVILGGLLVHGLRPGAQLFRDNPDVVYGFMLQMLLTAMLLIVFGGLVATRIFGQVLKLPRILLAPLIVCMTVVGVYTIGNSTFDLYVMLSLGLVGYAMDRLKYPTAPVVLGLVLGPMAEQQFRLALIISHGSFWALTSSLVSRIVILCTLAVLMLPILKVVKNRMKGGEKSRSTEG
jgi:putative tricarboxylic transport membrane protein